MTDWHPRGNSVDDGIAIARAMRAAGADLIHVEAGQTVHDDRPDYRRGFLTALSDRIRNEARVPTLVGGYLTTLDEANTIVGAGRADLVLLDLPEPQIEFRLDPACQAVHFGGPSVNFGELAYPDLEGRQAAVHLLPLGSTEPHGPHAPLATDTIISVGICRRAAERLRGEIDALVLPAVPYGVTRYGADFPGAISISEETLRSIVTEICAGLERVVLVNSHLEPEQVRTLRELGRPLFDVTRRHVAERG